MARAATDPTTSRSFLNSNGRWYSVTLLPECIRVSLDFDDRRMAEEVAAADASRRTGVLTFVGYRYITGFFVDPARNEMTIGTDVSKIVLPGWRAETMPLLRALRASRTDLASGARLLEEHHDARPINAFPQELADRTGLKLVTKPEDEIQQFGSGQRTAISAMDATRPIPVIRNTWDIARAVALLVFLTRFLSLSPDLDGRARTAMFVTGLLVAARMALTKVSFDDQSIVVRNIVRTRRIQVTEIESFGVTSRRGPRFNLVAITLKTRDVVVTRATASLSWPKAERVANSFSRFAYRHQIRNSVYPDHLRPYFAKKGGREVVRAGINLRRVRTRR